MDLKFSLISLVTGTFVAALTFASVSDGGQAYYWGAGLRIALVLSFLTSVLFAVYSKSHSKDFSLNVVHSRSGGDPALHNESIPRTRVLASVR